MPKVLLIFSKDFSLNYYILLNYIEFCDICWTFSALDRIITTGYRALQLQYFFTAGKDEVKAWTIQVLHWFCRKCTQILMYWNPLEGDPSPSGGGKDTHRLRKGLHYGWSHEIRWLQRGGIWGRLQSERSVLKQ